jgi:hypothetical protein
VACKVFYACYHVEMTFGSDQILSNPVNVNDS